VALRAQEWALTVWAVARRQAAVIVVLSTCMVICVLLLTNGPGNDPQPARAAAPGVADPANGTPTSTPIGALPSGAATTTVPLQIPGASSGGTGAAGSPTTVPPPSVGITPTTAVAATSGASGSLAPDCAGTSPEVAGTWTCSFDEEFNSDTLNRNEWLVQTTADSGYVAGDDCYEDSPENVSVSGGSLNLTAVKEPSPITCDFPGGSFSTQYTSGMVSTDHAFSQTYGVFEVRAAFPDANVPGLQSTLWLWPQNDKAYGSTGHDSGEIDFAEWFSQYADLDVPFIHYNNQPGDITTADCTLSDPSAFHTYGVEWNADSITILLDGSVCMTDNWNPETPQTKPEPFNLPFFVILTQALGITTNVPNGATPFPATTRVDWVRVWS
jgi:beta-glucanase (GH16 family)